MNVSSVKNLNGEVFSAVQDASLTNVVQTNSGNWQDITAYQSNSASYLTAHQDLSDYYTTSEAETLSSMLSGAIDYVSANAGDEFPVSADEAIQYVQTNSGTIDDTVTSYQTNSGTFLTAHQAISADEWNSNYETVNTNSGSWGGTPLHLSSRNGIDLEISNDTLFIGASALESTINDKLDITSFSDVSSTFLTGVDLSNYYTKSETSGADEIANALANIPTGDPDVNNYVVSNSAIIDDAVSTYQTNSATYLTAHQAISADEWNDCYDNVNTNSGVWGGSALTISAGPGINLSMVDGVLVISLA